MGLATRIIPTLLARGDVLVKGVKFDSWRSVGHVLQAARVHARRGVDELILLDIGATPEGRGPNFALVEKVAEAQFTPLTVGGGVRSVQDVRDLLNAGADKVAICTNAASVIPEASAKFGRQAIVACIDYIGSGLEATVRGSDRTAYDHADDCDDWGAGEILLTSVDREGTLEGYDLELVSRLRYICTCPLIVHGGCGTYEHMREALEAGASAVAAGAMFQFSDATPRGAAQYLSRQGVEVRL
jgi:cyclase